jgi:hypothetical protein
MLMCPMTATDEEIITLVESWLKLLEDERYEEASDAINDTRGPWNGQLLRTIVKGYGDARPAQRITMTGDSGARQRRDVDRFDGDDTFAGYVWYDLNIDHRLSDLTATFDLERRGDRLAILLADIHMM